MKATYQISEQDYVAAMKLHFGASLKTMLAYIIIALIIAIVAMLAAPQSREIIMGALAGAVLAIIVGRLVFVPLVSRRHYRKYKYIQDPITITVNEEGIDLASPDGAGLLRWEKILKWRQDERYMLVYLMPRLYYIIPKHIEEQGFDISAISSGLQERVGKES